MMRDHVAVIEAKNAGKPFGAFFVDIRSYCSASLMAAAGSLEALINETFIRHDGRLRSQLSNFDAAFWGIGGTRGIEKKPILAKYQHALALLGAPKMDEDGSVFKAADALIEFRNFIVHFKPRWDSDKQRSIDLYGALCGRYPLSPYARGGEDFFGMQSMSAGCAAWAVRSVQDVVVDFDSRTQLLDPVLRGLLLDL